MKKTLTILIALMALCFTQCKPKQEENSDNGEGKKVRISCSIPINNENRSDFTDLFEDGVINWSDGRECVYLAIPGDEPKVVELEGYCDGYKPTIEFIAYVDENLLTAGESYDIWYFGHSQQLDEPYVSLVDGNKIEGSIAKQTGRLKDLGYSHIASTTVTAVMENGEVKLPLVGKLKNRMAIALMDLEYMTSGLMGDAIKGTDYTLEYNTDTEKYEFNIIENSDALIDIEVPSAFSCVVLLPNENNKISLQYAKWSNSDLSNTYFYTGIKENKIYHGTDIDGNITVLLCDGEETYFSNGYKYVDLGLSVKWATCNVGAECPELYGDYYAFGELTPKASYEYSTYKYDGGSRDISGNIKYDVAISTWGKNWRIPKEQELNELVDNCNWEWITLNGVKGYKVVSKVNGNAIFLPAAGSDGGSGLGLYGLYRSSYAYGYSGNKTLKATYILSFGSTEKKMVNGRDLYFGYSIRPVID